MSSPPSPSSSTTPPKPINVPLPFEDEIKWSQICKVISPSNIIDNPIKLREAFNQLENGSAGDFFVLYFANHHSKVKEDKFFNTVLPVIQRLAVKLPELFSDPIPIFYAKKAQSITFTQLQVASLMSHSFFGTLIEPRLFCSSFSFPNANLTHLWLRSKSGLDDVDKPLSSVASIAECVLHYFERVSELSEEQMTQHKITITRRVLPQEQVPNWSECENPLPELKIFSDVKIEDSGCLLQADFANRYIGGGVLMGGNVQEEILFAIKSECLISMLFCERMGDNEAIIIKGAERFSQYSGYGWEFKYAGDFQDNTERDEEGLTVTEIFAIDAIPSRIRTDQFQHEIMKREIMKFYIGIMGEGDSLAPCASGRWGCGAFGGDLELKFIQQVIGCGAAKRPLVFMTFGDPKQQANCESLYQHLLKQNIHTGQLFNALLQFNPETDVHVFKFLKDFEFNRPTGMDAV
eukprot:TRINITY_DN2553_c0_g2_i1.p1 TRINITY_DN2553_c0_g2~~TRINITY_DN2553_c0_g2_i1.p1  ORF type:complete len:463 (-),score=100.62 TRINITY_DN2553_c0_g2_i1:1896-3284(-)